MKLSNMYNIGWKCEFLKSLPPPPQKKRMGGEGSEDSHKKGWVGKIGRVILKKGGYYLTNTN